MYKRISRGIKILILGAVGSLALSACSTEDKIAGRWYSQAQVDAGGKVFAEHCASCHGKEAQGRVMNWKKPDADGNYPPPPLNGSAHAWHHPLSQLKRTIRQGGAPLGGQMPSFEGKLTEAEIKQALAWVQSHWNARIYDEWLKRGGLR
jgi:mono/diheme cytochrome c family protein